MCGKASSHNLSWSEIYAWATTLRAPSALPPDPVSRINISPSRLRRKSEPDSMVWESLPVIRRTAGVDEPSEALWPFIPPYSEGRLPRNRDGRLISTANARLRSDGAPFAPTFMGAWRAEARVLVAVSWFYEFDSRVRPQIPYAVFPLDAPCWLMAGIARTTRMADGSRRLTVAVITVAPNEVLTGVGHHRSPALLRSPDEARRWLDADPVDALQLLRPYPNESMGVEAVPMDVKIPGNENFELPHALKARFGATA
jgi:putative SOS response-associated peptidase YedK